MINGKIVAPTHSGKHRRDNILRDIVDALTARAHEMVVMFGVARDVGGHMAVTLEATRHPVFDLLLERPVDGGAADRRVGLANAFVQLLRGERALCGSEGFRDDDSLRSPAPASRRKARVDRSGAHRARIEPGAAI